MTQQQADVERSSLSEPARLQRPGAHPRLRRNNRLLAVLLISLATLSTRYTRNMLLQSLCQVFNVDQCCWLAIACKCVQALSEIPSWFFLGCFITWQIASLVRLYIETTWLTAEQRYKLEMAKLKRQQELWAARADRS